MRNLSPFFVVVFFCSCGGPDRLQWAVPEADEADDSPEPAADPSSNSQAPSLQILRVEFEQEGPLVLTAGGSFKLSVRLTLSNGITLTGIDSAADLPGTRLDDAVVWFSNNEGIAAVSDDGNVTGRRAGSTTVKASYLYQAAVIDVIATRPAVTSGTENSESVSNFPSSQTSSGNEDADGNNENDNDYDSDLDSDSENTAGDSGSETADEVPSETVPLVATEAPQSTRDYFLSANDILTFTFGTNSGFGAHLYPGIIYGVPRTGGTHVVSFGGGGSLLIELNDYIVVNGPGSDFTVFENAVVSDLWGNFFERAQVSVSDDGSDFRTFPCEAIDPEEIYAGCAGVTPVHATNNPLDPTVSGGDSFDLADVGLTEAKFILIEDLDTCHPGDPTYLDTEGNLLCGIVGQQGFDLDAVAIVNGRNE